MKQNEIKEKIDQVSPFVGNKDIVDGMTDFVFKDGRIYGYDYSIFSSVPFDLPGTDEPISVPAKELNKIISEIDSDKEIEITINSNSLVIKCDDIEAELVIGKEKEVFEKIPDLPESFTNLPNNFTKAMQSCMYTCSNDNSDIKSCISFSGDKAISTDVLRISEYILNKEIEKQILMPVSYAKLLSKFDLKEFNETDSWLFFQDGDVIVGFLGFNDDYPDTESFFDFNSIDIYFPKKVIELIKTAEVLSEENDELEKAIEIEIGLDYCIAKGENEKGKVFHKISGIETKLEETIIFQANPEMLRIALKGDYNMVIAENYDRIMFSAKDFRQLHSLKYSVPEAYVKKDE